MNNNYQGPNQDYQMSHEEESIDLNHYLWMLRRGKWIILGFVLAGLLAAGYVNRTTTPVYSSSSTFIYTADNSMSRTLDMPGTSWFQMDATRNDQIHLINSRTLAEQVADSVLHSPDSDSLIAVLFTGSVPDRQYIRNSLVGMAQARVSVSWIKDTDFFVLTGSGYSPEASAVITNLVLHVYYRWNRLQARGENREVRMFLEEQLLLISNQLESSETELLLYKESNDITDIDAETRNLINNLSSFETQMRAAGANADAARVRRDYLSGLLAQQRESVGVDIANANNGYVMQIQEDLARYEGARATLLAEGALPDSDPVLSVESRITTKRDELTRALEDLSGINYPTDPARGMESLVSSLASAEAEYRSSTARMNALDRVVANLNSNLSGLPEMQHQLVSLERNRTVNENIYVLLRTRYEEVRIAEVGQMGNVTIVDTALPGGMIRPTSRRNLIMGILVGFAAGIGLVFLMNQMNNTLRSPEQLERYGIPLLGVIPTFTVKREKGTFLLAMLESPKSPAAEAIRDLRTSLSFSRPGEKIKKLLITSSGPQEGKSSISANLAIAEAHAGKKVILVDCDLRRPVINKAFGYHRKPGFTELVTGKATLEEVIRQTEIPGLSVVCSGHIPSNPSEMADSAVRQDLFDTLAECADLIIVDSPPAAVVTDAVSISAVMDSVLLVSRSGKVQQKVVQGVWQKLQRTGVHLSGAVMNDFDPVSSYTSYTYYTYRYQYYYSENS